MSSLSEPAQGRGYFSETSSDSEAPQRRGGVAREPIVYEREKRPRSGGGTPGGGCSRGARGRSAAKRAKTDGNDAEGEVEDEGRLRRNRGLTKGEIAEAEALRVEKEKRQLPAQIDARHQRFDPLEGSGALAAKEEERKLRLAERKRL